MSVRLIAPDTASDLEEYFRIFNENNKCPYADSYFFNIVNPSSEHYAKGTLVFVEDTLLGITKDIGEATLIPFPNTLGLVDMSIYDLALQDYSKIPPLTRKITDRLRFGKYKRWKSINFSGELLLGVFPEVNPTLQDLLEYQGEFYLSDSFFESLGSIDPPTFGRKNYKDRVEEFGGLLANLYDLHKDKAPSQKTEAFQIP